MLINNLSLTNFRSYTKSSFNFDANSTLILGPNASGKTDIMEAIFLLATGTSMRATYDKEMVKQGKQYARLQGEVEEGGEKRNLEVYMEVDEKFENLARKKVKINGVGKTQLDFVGTLKVVLFEPEDIGLIIRSPKLRRNYLDTIFTQIDRQYIRSLKEYTQILRQRNKLLEKINETGIGWDQLEFWNRGLLTSGGVIHEKREDFFNFLKKILPKLGKELDNDGESLKVEYKKSLLSKERQKGYQQKEVAAKATLIGPHRDDFEIYWQGYNLARFGSRGEQRTAVLALKLAEIEFISEKVGERPVLLLDDIFSELDHRHRESVFFVLGKQQTIVTTTDIHLIDNRFLEKLKIINLGRPGLR